MLEKTPLQTRKELGLAHLNADRVEEGLKIYAMILRDYPEDVESYIVIGDCYLAQGEKETAAQLYAYALELSPENAEINRRLRLAKAEMEPRTQQGEEGVPELRSIGRLLQRILGQPHSVTEKEINRASQLLDVIKQSPRPALAVAEHLGDIETLIPAMLELNIRQARSEGRPDLAQALDDLLDSVREQLSAAGPAEQDQGTKARVLLLVPSVYQLPARAMFVLKALGARGYEPVLASERVDINEIDVALAFNPHGDAKMMEFAAACAAAKKPVILDLEYDFEELPSTHPAYPAMGLSTPEAARTYMAAVMLAERVVTPSRLLAEKFSRKGRPTQVIPHGWIAKTGQRQKPPNRRHIVHLGWIGSNGEIEDVAMIRRMVMRILREFPHTQLVIGGDAQVYQMFDRIPETRRLYLPPVSAEDYPYLLGQIDILLAPMQDTLFNQSRSDRRLMEAGARRIPWVASPMPAYVEWSEGGMIAASSEDWTQHLRALVQDADLRATCGAAGFRKAQERELAHVGLLWQRLIEDALAKMKKKG